MSTIEKLKEILISVLKHTELLAREEPAHDTKFCNVFLGIYRVAFITLRDIYFLSSHKESGSSALDLTRKIIELGVTIEYMIMKGKEDMANRFQEYLWKQAHDEMEFLKSTGQNPAEISNDMKIGTEDAERRYEALSSKIKGDKSWAGVNPEQMIIALHENGALDDFDKSRLVQAYTWGCRLNHPNPFVTHAYLNQEDQEGAEEYYLRMALFLSITIHLRLTTRFIEEIQSTQAEAHQELSDQATRLYKDLEAVTEDITDP
jgi:hypothetical protein